MHRRITLKVRTGQSFEEFKFETPRQFRLFYLNSEDCPRIVGKMPWHMIRRPLRQWLRDWAVKQDDIVAFEATLQEHIPGMTIESLLAVLEETGGRAQAYFKEESGKRDGAIAFHIIMEILKAVVRRLRKGNMKSLSRWEVESLPNNGGIYNILLRGGQNEKSFHDNQGE